MSYDFIGRQRQYRELRWRVLSSKQINQYATRQLDLYLYFLNGNISLYNNYSR